jgi:hydrogenase maturation protein HypF
VSSFRRVAHLRQFRLPGGDAAIQQPCRSAIGLLYETWGRDALRRLDLPLVNGFNRQELTTFCQMLEKGLNAPLTSSAGRLFDAVAALIGLRKTVSFEGQSAMELEFAVDPKEKGEYPFAIGSGEPAVIDWQPMVEGILEDLRHGQRASAIAAKFHHTLAAIITHVALGVGEAQVVLTGGCFQNRTLTEECIRRLHEAGLRPYWHQRVPTNDGGIALGQIVAAAAVMKTRGGDVP